MNIGLCGCGRPARYMTPSGDACNKYMRCLTYEGSLLQLLRTNRALSGQELGEALKQANCNLLNLLALIHRDGGHHVQAVGLEQALVDAEQVLYKWRGAYDVLVPHNAELCGVPSDPSERAPT